MTLYRFTIDVDIPEPLPTSDIVTVEAQPGMISADPLDWNGDDLLRADANGLVERVTVVASERADAASIADRTFWCNWNLGYPTPPAQLRPSPAVQDARRLQEEGEWT